jgi:hypothetical protein
MPAALKKAIIGEGSSECNDSIDCWIALKALSLEGCCPAAYLALWIVEGEE